MASNSSVTLYLDSFQGENILKIRRLLRSRKISKNYKINPSLRLYWVGSGSVPKFCLQLITWRHSWQCDVSSPPSWAAWCPHQWKGIRSSHQKTSSTPKKYQLTQRQKNSFIKIRRDVAEECLKDGKIATRYFPTSVDRSQRYLCLQCKGGIFGNF